MEALIWLFLFFIFSCAGCWPYQLDHRTYSFKATDGISVGLGAQSSALQIANVPGSLNKQLWLKYSVVLPAAQQTNFSLKFQVYDGSDPLPSFIFLRARPADSLGYPWTQSDLTADRANTILNSLTWFVANCSLSEQATQVCSLNFAGLALTGNTSLTLVLSFTTKGSITFVGSGPAGGGVLLLISADVPLPMPVFPTSQFNLSRWFPSQALISEVVPASGNRALKLSDISNSTSLVTYEEAKERCGALGYVLPSWHQVCYSQPLTSSTVWGDTLVPLLPSSSSNDTTYFSKPWVKISPAYQPTSFPNLWVRLTSNKAEGDNSYPGGSSCFDVVVAPKMPVRLIACSGASSACQDYDLECQVPDRSSILSCSSFLVNCPALAWAGACHGPQKSVILQKCPRSCNACPADPCAGKYLNAPCNNGDSLTASGQCLGLPLKCSATTCAQGPAPFCPLASWSALVGLLGSTSARAAATFLRSGMPASASVNVELIPDRYAGLQGVAWMTSSSLTATFHVPNLIFVVYPDDADLPSWLSFFDFTGDKAVLRVSGKTVTCSIFFWVVKPTLGFEVEVNLSVQQFAATNFLVSFRAFDSSDLGFGNRWLSLKSLDSSDCFAAGLRPCFFAEVCGFANLPSNTVIPPDIPEHFVRDNSAVRIGDLIINAGNCSVIASPLKVLPTCCRSRTLNSVRSTTKAPVRTHWFAASISSWDEAEALCLSQYGMDLCTTNEVCPGGRPDVQASRPMWTPVHSGEWLSIGGNPTNFCHTGVPSFGNETGQICCSAHGAQLRRFRTNRKTSLSNRNDGTLLDPLLMPLYDNDLTTFFDCSTMYLNISNLEVAEIKVVATGVEMSSNISSLLSWKSQGLQWVFTQAFVTPVRVGSLTFRSIFRPSYIYELQITYDINDCLSYPCENGGTCVNNIGSMYTCVCPPYTTGYNCEVSVDICQYAWNMLKMDYVPRLGNACPGAVPCWLGRCLCPQGTYQVYTASTDTFLCEPLALAASPGSTPTAPVTTQGPSGSSSGSWPPPSPAPLPMELNSSTVSVTSSNVTPTSMLPPSEVASNITMIAALAACLGIVLLLIGGVMIAMLLHQRRSALWSIVNVEHEHSEVQTPLSLQVPSETPVTSMHQESALVASTVPVPLLREGQRVRICIGFSATADGEMDVLVDDVVKITQVLGHWADGIKLQGSTSTRGWFPVECVDYEFDFDSQML